MSNTIEQRKALEKIMPFQLLKMNAEYYALNCKLGKKPVPELVELGIKTLNQMLYDLYRELPSYRREGAARKAQMISNKIYNKYFFNGRFDTQDITIITHNWIESLRNDEYFTELDERAVYIFRYLDIIFRKAARGRSEFINKDEFCQAYINAMKHVPKIHEIALSEGLYLKQ